MYQKQSVIAGVFDTFDPASIGIDLQRKLISVTMSQIVTGADGRPVQTVQFFTIQDDATDPAKNWFSQLAGQDFAGANLYDRIKTGLYQILIAKGDLPPVSDGWAIV